MPGLNSSSLHSLNADIMHRYSLFSSLCSNLFYNYKKLFEEYLILLRFLSFCVFLHKDYGSCVSCALLFSVGISQSELAGAEDMCMQNKL